MNENLRIYSIFKSISGEIGAIPQGSPAVFLRLAGCNMSCDYCDTKITQSKKSGEEVSINWVAKQIEDLSTGNRKNLLITGGEPLLQKKNIFKLLRRLWMNDRYHVQIETNGSQDIKDETKFISSFVIDYKLKADDKYVKGFEQRILQNLHRNDWIKFVCKDSSDYKLAKKLYFKWDKRFDGFLNMAFSATNEALSSEELANLLIEDDISAVLNVQIHKLIGVQ